MEEVAHGFHFLTCFKFLNTVSTLIRGYKVNVEMNKKKL